MEGRDRAGRRLDMLLKALGPGWWVGFDSGYWRRWRLRMGDADYVGARRRGDIPKRFVSESKDPSVRAAFEIPDFLACESVEELELRLEVAYG